MQRRKGEHCKRKCWLPAASLPLPQRSSGRYLKSVQESQAGTSHKVSGDLQAPQQGARPAESSGGGDWSLPFGNASQSKQTSARGMLIAGVLLYHKSKLKAQVIWGFLGDSDGKESACNAGDPGWIPGSGRSPGGGHGNPLQFSCLENPMDRAVWGLHPMGSQRVGHDWATNTSDGLALLIERQHSQALLGWTLCNLICTATEKVEGTLPVLQERKWRLREVI